MFGIKIITRKELDRLKAEISAEHKAERHTEIIDNMNQLRIEILGVVKSGFQEFTTDAVQCIQNNLHGFADTLAGRPCAYHNEEMEALQKKYLNHETRIKQLESDVKKLKK
jgi:hypothetical protein